jgi:hypothetical protein
MPFMTAGQASAEYTALLALAGVVLAGAGAVVGLGGVGTAVADGVRTGICIVAGDICRASDAKAAGLSPCTLSERTDGGATKLTMLSFRIGAAGAWTVASRSDGSVVLTRTDGKSAGVAVGIGVSATPFDLRFGAKGSYDLAVATGEAWELRDAAAARRFLVEHDRPSPTWRFGDLGGELTGKAGAFAGGAMLTGAEATANAAAGVRVGRGRTTLYVKAKIAGPDLEAWLPGGGVKRTARGTGDLLVELTREHGDLREIAFRTVERGEHEGELVETVGRLDLRVPANRAAAAPLLALRLPWPPSVIDDLRAVVRRTAQAGVVERAVYSRRDDSERLDLSAQLGLSVGLQADRISEQRRLMSATAWTGGSRERERFDCLSR